MLVNYGFDRVRFLQAVPVGSSVRLSGSLVEVRERTDASAVLSIDVQLTCEPDLQAGPALVARWLFLAQPG
jgi:acyl dehydratase